MMTYTCLTPTSLAPSSSASSRLPCAPSASRSRTRSSRRWFRRQGVLWHEFKELFGVMTGKIGEKDPLHSTAYCSPAANLSSLHPASEPTHCILT